MTLRQFLAARSTKRAAARRPVSAPPEIPAATLQPCQHAFLVLDKGVSVALAKPARLPPSLRRELPPPVL